MISNDVGAEGEENGDDRVWLLDIGTLLPRKWRWCRVEAADTSVLFPEATLS